MSPPLRGDAQGRFRISVVGNSGTGKVRCSGTPSTLQGLKAIDYNATPSWALARNPDLVARHGPLRAELGPGMYNARSLREFKGRYATAKVPKPVFRARVQEFLDAHDEWVIDGNATNSLDGIVGESATDVICAP